jgi:hypothetical protein
MYNFLQELLQMYLGSRIYHLYSIKTTQAKIVLIFFFTSHLIISFSRRTLFCGLSYKCNTLKAVSSWLLLLGISFALGILYLLIQAAHYLYLFYEVKSAVTELNVLNKSVPGSVSRSICLEVEGGIL